jgi:hypothetical protein
MVSPSKADTDVMGVARQASATATGSFMFQLKAKGHDEREDTFEERLPIAKQLEVCRFAPEIDDDGAVFSRQLSRCAHVSSYVIRFRQLRRHNGDHTLKSQDYREGLRVLPLIPMECDTFCRDVVCTPICFSKNGKEHPRTPLSGSLPKTVAIAAVLAVQYKRSMKIYHCELPYLSGLMGEPAPHWPQDYKPAEDMDRAGLPGKEALEWAFEQRHAAGRDMKPGDVVGLDDGTLWRCEMAGWLDIGKLCTARAQNGRERAR